MTLRNIIHKYGTKFSFRHELSDSIYTVLASGGIFKINAGDELSSDMLLKLMEEEVVTC